MTAFRLAAMIKHFNLSSTPRNAMGSRQTVSSELTPREFHPNCRSDRAALIACDGFITLGL